MEPSALLVCIVTSPRFCPVILMSSESFVNSVRSAVPAILDFTPEFAISPMASETSSMENPSAPAIGAQYWNVSPIMETLVFAFAEAAASTSEKCATSSAFSPNAVMASVTISEVVARSPPEAAASEITPPIPSSICSASQPAIAM